VKLIMAIAAPAVPAPPRPYARLAVRSEGDGTLAPQHQQEVRARDVVQVVMLWNTTNLGYLTVQAAALARVTDCPRRDLDAGGRLGAMDVRGAEVLLGAPLVMTKANIDQFDF
jgi:hypothetical protein